MAHKSKARFYATHGKFYSTVIDRQEDDWMDTEDPQLARRVANLLETHGRGPAKKPRKARLKRT